MTSVTVPPESEALETGSLTKMPGTSHLPALRRPEKRAPERAAWIDPPIARSNRGHVIATSEEDGRKCVLLTLFVTRYLFRHEPLALA
jgi:hypothetical protein